MDLQNLNPFADVGSNLTLGGWRYDQYAYDGGKSATPERAPTYRTLPGFGPQAPAADVGYVTSSFPGSSFDTGLAVDLSGTGSLPRGFSRNASRPSTDAMENPYMRTTSAQEQSGKPFDIFGAGKSITAQVAGLNPFTAGQTGIDRPGVVAQGGNMMGLGLALAAAAAAVYVFKR